MWTYDLISVRYQQDYFLGSWIRVFYGLEAAALICQPLVHLCHFCINVQKQKKLQKIELHVATVLISQSSFSLASCWILHFSAYTSYLPESSSFLTVHLPQPSQHFLQKMIFECETPTM